MDDNGSLYRHEVCPRCNLRVIPTVEGMCPLCSTNMNEVKLETKKHRNGGGAPPERIEGKDGVPMVLIRAGRFMMGGQEFNDEIPVHMVYLDAFYLDVYEVTNSQYRRFVEDTGHKEPVGWGYVEEDDQRSEFKPWLDKNFNGDDQPVVCVSWEDAKAYAEWVGKRLPTEAEWEKAARGGLWAYRYPWGNVCTPINANYWDIDNKGFWRNWRKKQRSRGDRKYTTPVGSFAPNGYGLYDMAGNVYEWCADWYDGSYYARSPEKNPMGPSEEVYRVIRGGCWRDSDPAHYLRVAYRAYRHPTTSAACTIGFRCAQDVDITS